MRAAHRLFASCLLVVLVAGPALADGKRGPGGLQQSAYWGRSEKTKSLKSAFENTRFEQRFSKSLRPLLVKSVPVVSRKDAALPWVDPAYFAEYGIPLGRFGLTTKAQEKQILKAIAIRPAEPGEKPTRHAVATRYSDEGVKTVISNKGEVRMGRWVAGDGRAGVIGAPLARKRRTGNGRKAVEVQTLRVKGFPTGLSPRQDWKDVHTTGSQGDVWAAVDVVLGQFLHANGINVNRTPALATTHDSFVIDIYGRQLKQNKAFELNAGHFDRLAHLNEIRHSRRAMSQFISGVNALVSAELGRTRRLPLDKLFVHLVRRKAREVVDLYWTRAAHGSPTFDNIGLLQTIDVATVTPVDRPHPHHTLLRGVSDGFAAEPQQFLAPYSEFLFQGFVEVATGPQRARLQRIDPRALVKRELHDRMAANALEHLGVDARAITWLMRTSRPQVDRFLRAVRRYGEQEAPGAVATMGATVKTEVKNPARYDIFSALSRLGTVWSADTTRQAKVVDLVAALRPVDGHQTRDRRAASALLDAAAPILERLTGNARPAVKREMIGIMGDQARRLNEPIDRMVRSSLDDWTAKLYDKVHTGRISNARFRGEINALTRDNIRRGPQSVSQVVERIHQGRVETDPSGRVLLSRIDEHGVRIEELSDGQRHAVRFSIAAAALRRGHLGRPLLKYSLDGTRWHEASPSRTARDGTVVFEIPVSGALSSIQGRFVDRAKPGRVWDLDGLGFGVGHRPLLASKAVKAALGLRHASATGSHEQDPDALAAGRLVAQPWLANR